MTTFSKLGTVSLAAILLAAPSNANNNIFFKSGFIAGGSLGYSNMKNSFSTHSENENILVGDATVTSEGQHKSISTCSLTGSFFAGYRHITSSNFVYGFNLSVSVDGNSMKNSGTINTVNFNTKLSRKFQITPSLVLGYKFADRWMAFTELGLSISRFTLQSTRTDDSVTKSYKKSFTKIGFVPTLGIEHAFNEKISMIGTATYEIFGSTKKDVGSTYIGTVGVTEDTTQNTVKVRPRYLSFKLGALYKF